MREVQDVVHEPDKPVSGQLDGLEIRTLLFIQLGVERQVRHADDGVQRRAEFVARPGEELALREVRAFRFVAREPQLPFQDASTADLPFQIGHGVPQLPRSLLHLGLEPLVENRQLLFHALSFRDVVDDGVQDAPAADL